jgi:hypothetical protein
MLFLAMSTSAFCRSSPSLPNITNDACASRTIRSMTMSVSRWMPAIPQSCRALLAVAAATSVLATFRLQTSAGTSAPHSVRPRELSSALAGTLVTGVLCIHGLGDERTYLPDPDRARGVTSLMGARAGTSGSLLTA